MKDRLYQLMDWPRIENIVYSEEDHPGEILGPHPVGGSTLYQAFFPFAKKVTLVLEDKTRKIAMEEADEEGYYAVMAGGRFSINYHYEIIDKEGKLLILNDPYAFSLVVDEEDLVKFSHGVHYELPKLLGSHLTILNGVKGILFLLWMPEAVRVSVVGEFNRWDGRIHPMNRIGKSDLFTLFLPGLTQEDAYRYEVKSYGDRITFHEDPFAAKIMIEGKKCSLCYQESRILWKDRNYLDSRKEKRQEPFLYQTSLEDLENPQDLIDQVTSEGYTHILLPQAYGGKNFYEYSLGFGSQYKIKSLVNILHQTGIGVIFRWNIQDLKELGNKVIRNFYLSNILHLMGQYHFDGVVFSGMAELLYLDYGRQEGEWNPNIFGGNENLDAIEWLKHTNSVLKTKIPHVLLFADMEAIWPKVTESLEEEGLGFDYRYDTDFSSDYLSYLKTDPYFRSGVQEKITNRMLYAYQERFLMAFDEDAKDLWFHLTGEEEDRFKTMKLAAAYPIFLPGKLLFSFCAEKPYQKQLSRMIREAYTWNRCLSPLQKEDENINNFHWINCFRNNDCAVSFYRDSDDEKGVVLVIVNFANAKKENFLLGAPYEGKYKLFFSTESTDYGGSMEPDIAPVYTREEEWDGFAHSLCLDVQALSLNAYVFLPYTEEEIYEAARKKAEKLRLKLEEEARNKVDKLKKSSLKDTLALQVEKYRKDIDAQSKSRP